MKNKFDIFICYRHEGGSDFALQLYNLFMADEYKITYDVDILTFDSNLRHRKSLDELYDRIDNCTNFIIVLNKTIFDRTIAQKFQYEIDWVRLELARAIEKEKNIIPIMLTGYEWPSKNELPEDIASIAYYNCLDQNDEYIISFYNRLKQFLHLNNLNRNEVFISYSRKDYNKVKIIKDTIDREVGIDCWMDLDGIESGEQFKNVIIKAINEHDTILFMLSDNSMKSNWALDELAFAEHKKKRIIIVFIEACQMTDDFFFSYQKKDSIIWDDDLQRKKLIGDLHKWYPNRTRHKKNIQELAEERDAEAQYKMGCDYFYRGDFIEASKWFLKAASQGHILAPSYMGWLYEHGEGVLLDYEEAFRWYKKAAENGDVKSQNKLGYFYSCGKGVKQDYIQSAYWYRKSAEQGNEDAIDWLEKNNIT